ncbi:indolepyruvate ferredoxin oxidoreductase subunit alpha [Methanobrevibacter olleyae]|uniref:Indolepyruvate ferredoxin oxidoreductase subunit alpha n=1 Tax=Methanobrevibacter olleyae TaxID=294671 RepID=A0A126QZP7_METOL|nr:indolepyruvate ferredoxin oxidoreductase subunit alpha [Methanobrevibacter olleyae]AMK14855.1 indolepyruvate ferredoxin oxidoreductase alpha subunit IorA [Methanobrevibacter olleyae]
MAYDQLVTSKKGDKLFLLGNEAAVRGAIEAGVSVAATYPGTPSSEIGNILSVVAKNAEMYFEFSANEKVAMEVAATAAASGIRSFTFMKHVGLNVAADSFMTTAYSGLKGGMIVLVADDPSLFSSQNEQDTRNYSRLSSIPILEPSSPQEIKDMMVYGFDLSETFGIPVILRTSTRVSHMRGIVECGEISKPKSTTKEITSDKHWLKGYFVKNPREFVPVPANALEMHERLVAKIEKIEEIANESPINEVYSFESGALQGKYGVISSGGAFNYAYDVISQESLGMDILKLALSYPTPKDLIYDFCKNLDGVFIVEEVDPVLERDVLAVLGEYNLDCPVYGKFDGTFPMIHEFNLDIVKESFNKVISDLKDDREFKEDYKSENAEDFEGNLIEILEKMEFTDGLNELLENIPTRAPTLCAGCSHRSAYFAAVKAYQELGYLSEDMIFASDIGCYTLGISPPYETADYLLSMGSSVGDGCGFSVATDQHVMSFIGDSTFFHSGLSPLVNAVHNKNKFVLTILDNRITAMTGGQPNPGIPVDGMGDEAPAIPIEDIVEAIGVKFLKIVNPHNIKKTVDIYKEALEYDGVAVVIARYPCTLIKGQKKKAPMVIKDNCVKCLECVKTLACPAISYLNDKVIIDEALCKSCAVCIQVCPNKAIGVKKGD